MEKKASWGRITARMISMFMPWISRKLRQPTRLGCMVLCPNSTITAHLADNELAKLTWTAPVSQT